MKYNWEEIYKKLKEGFTYQEIVEEYGMAYATLVRKWKAHQAGELAAMELNHDEETLRLLAKKELRILTEQKKNSIIRREIQSMSRESAVLDLIKEALEKKSIKPLTQKKYNKKDVDKKGHIQTFIVSDLHFVDSERSDSLNKMGQMWLDNHDGSSEVKIVINGDAIENTHHLEQLLDGGNAITQSIDVANIIAEQIAFFLDNVPEGVTVKTYWVVGNHDEIRQLGVKSGDTKNINVIHVIEEIVLKHLNNYFEDGRYETKYLGMGGKISYSNSSKNKTINIRHGHQFKSNIQQNIEKSLIKEAVQGNGFDHIYVISHFHQFRHWIMKGSDVDMGENIAVVMTPSMKDWNGEFEEWNMTKNTSGMVSIDEYKNVKYIPIP